MKSNKLEKILDGVKNVASRTWKFVKNTKYAVPFALGLGTAVVSPTITTPAYAQCPTCYNGVCPVSIDQTTNGSKESEKKYNLSLGLDSLNGEITFLSGGTDIFEGETTNINMSLLLPLSKEKKVNMELGYSSVSEDIKFPALINRAVNGAVVAMQNYEQRPEVLVSKAFENFTVAGGVSFDESSQLSTYRYIPESYAYGGNYIDYFIASGASGPGIVIKGSTSSNSSKIPINFSYRVNWLNKRPQQLLEVPFESNVEDRIVDQAFSFSAPFKKGRMTYTPFFSERNSTTYTERKSAYIDLDGVVRELYVTKGVEPAHEITAGLKVQFGDYVSFVMSNSTKSNYNGSNDTQTTEGRVGLYFTLTGGDKPKNGTLVVENK